MTSEALLPVVSALFGVGNIDVRIMAGETGKLVAAHALTFALPQTFEVPDHFELGLVWIRPNKRHDVVAQQVAGAIGGFRAAWFHDSRLACQMALGTNTVASFGVEFDWVDDCGSNSLGVLLAGSVAAFTGDSAFFEQAGCEGFQSAGVTRETGCFDFASEED